jgi:hypothetical protein
VIRGALAGHLGIMRLVGVARLSGCAVLVQALVACTSGDHQVGLGPTSGSGPGGAGGSAGSAAGLATNQGGTRPNGTGGASGTEQGGRSAQGGTGGGGSSGAAGRDAATGGVAGVAGETMGGGGGAGAGAVGGAAGTGAGGEGATAGVSPGGAPNGGAAGSAANPCPTAACRDDLTCLQPGVWTTCQCDGVAALPVCEGPRFLNLGVSTSFGHFGLGDLTDDGRLAIGCRIETGSSVSHAISWTLAGGVVPLDVPNARCATSMNGDGSVIAGTHTDDSVFIWTRNGVEFPNVPAGIGGFSRDGSVFFGDDTQGTWHAYYAVRGEAPIVLGDWTYATGLSADGSHLVGHINDDRGLSFRFTPEDGFEILPSPSGAQYTFATHVSPDGSLIAGYSRYSDGDSGQPVLWENGVLVTPDVLRAPLGYQAAAVNNTWTAAGGTQYNETIHQAEAVLWTKGIGWRLLADLLRDRVTGWTFVTINDISADGKKLIGIGIGPDEWWYRFYAELP